jgi:RHS repeat-associated protein
MARGGSTFFYHQDGLGTVTELTDSAGVTAKSYAYDAWGNQIETTGTVENPYTYTGRELDAETGLYYYRERYYDPQTGRFLRKDPVGFAGGLNLYLYVRADPQDYIDPRGLLAKGIHHEVTRQALANIGRECKEFGEDLPQAVYDVDDAPDSQDRANAIWHSLLPWSTDKLSDARETIRWGNYISENFYACNASGLANVLHAGQDYPAGGHGLQHHYIGSVFGLPLVSPLHALSDMVPGEAVFVQARQISEAILNKWIQECGCKCPHQ